MAAAILLHKLSVLVAVKSQPLVTNLDFKACGYIVGCLSLTSCGNWLIPFGFKIHKRLNHIGPGLCLVLTYLYGSSSAVAYPSKLIMMQTEIWLLDTVYTIASSHA